MAAAVKTAKAKWNKEQEAEATNLRDIAHVLASLKGDDKKANASTAKAEEYDSNMEAAMKLNSIMKKRRGSP